MAEEINIQTEVIEKEIYRRKYKEKYIKVLKTTFYSLLVVIAISVLISSLILPVIQIYGTSMSPTLNEKEIVVCLKDKSLERGDICAFYYNNKILVKRIVGLPGDKVYIEKDGTVYINGERYKENYIINTSIGECDIEFPYTVPETSYFVMGDNRESSLDSRLKSVGPVEYENILGRLFYRLYPFNSIKVF